MKSLQIRNAISDFQELDRIIHAIEEIVNIDDINEFRDKAEKILDNLISFRHIMKRHKRIEFQYKDVFENEFSKYYSGEVASICVFDGIVYLTPFDQLLNASELVITKERTRISYPSYLKVGNEAIGQAWLSDGTEVFSPRHALNHTLNSTANMLRNWAYHYKKHLEKEVR